VTIAPGGGKRIIILASSADAVAIDLPARLARSDIAVVTPTDLSQPGWSYRPGRRESAIVVGGEMLQCHDIAAVVTRLPWVSDVELPHIVASDRSYVAAEMGAFLLAWLSEIDCPVANRPRPNCLCGPFWRHERWVLEAARIGLEEMRRDPLGRGAFALQQLRGRRVQPQSPAGTGESDATLEEVLPGPTSEDPADRVIASEELASPPVG